MTNEIEERRKKRRARRVRRRFLSFLGFILMLIYIPALWNWFFSVNYEIASIGTSTLEIKVPVNGLFLRKEFVLKSPGDGILIPAVQYGERVGKGNEVVSFIQNDMREVVENYKQMEIEILKRVVADFDKTSGTERAMWESAIEQQINKLTNISENGDLSDAGSVRKSIDNILEAKARYMLESNSVMNKLGKEKDELDRYRSSIEKSVKKVYSPVSGIVSYSLDGQEESFTFENSQNITIEQINEAASASANDNDWITSTEIEVRKDEPFCKVIDNDEALIALTVPEKEGKEILVSFERAKLAGSKLEYAIEIDGLDQRSPVTIESIGEPVEGTYKMFARLTKYIDRTIDIRGFKGNLIVQNVSGMVVPLRSLFNVNSVDNTADLAVVEMDKAVFKRVKIIGQQDSYAIIENIDPTREEEHVNVFDIYLVNPKNVVEGQVVEK